MSDSEGLRSAAYNTSAMLQEYAQKRIAQMQRAKQLKQERAQQETAQRMAEEYESREAAGVIEPAERHLPTCQCSRCSSGMRAEPEIKVPVSKWDDPPPRRELQPPPTKKVRAAQNTRKSDKPEWNSEFTEECSDGFDVFARRRAAQDVREKRQKPVNKPGGVGGGVGGVGGGLRAPPKPNKANTARQQAPRLSTGLSDHPKPALHKPVKNDSKLGGLGGGIPHAKSQDGPSTRTNFDKRTSRQMHKASFTAAIDKTEWPNKVPHGRLPASHRVSMIVRKRPLLDHEITMRNEYDVVKVDEEKCRIFIHNCLMHADMHRMHMVTHAFPSSAAFGENSTSETIYTSSVQPLVVSVLRGGVSTILMNGQTGSGKTFTMTAIEKQVAHDLFQHLPHGGQIVVSMFEIAGRICRDLLGTSEVTFMEGEDGQLHLCGAAEESPGSAAFLLHVINGAKDRRATQTTAQNATSSRSHAICRISIILPDGSCCGRLVLVDCAGSERKEDSAKHTAERRKEGAEINSSLHALKECMRAVVSNSAHIPFRQHTLTKALKESFTFPGAHFAVISTISPSATDTEHSISTLRSACDFASCGDMTMEKKEDVQRANNSSRRSVSVPLKCGGGGGGGALKRPINTKPKIPAAPSYNHQSSPTLADQLNHAPTHNRNSCHPSTTPATVISNTRQHSTTVLHEEQQFAPSVHAATVLNTSHDSMHSQHSGGGGSNHSNSPPRYTSPLRDVFGGPQQAQTVTNDYRSIYSNDNSFNYNNFRGPVGGGSPSHGSNSSSGSATFTKVNSGHPQHNTHTNNNRHTPATVIATHHSNNITSHTPCKPYGNSPPQKKANRNQDMLHPNRWTPQDAQQWVSTHIKGSIQLPLGTDGKTLMKWPLQKCVGFCNGSSQVGLKLFNGLRLEVDRVAAEETKRRKAVMAARDG